ncbi:hypothetical protein N0V82_000849 [Gnomoniopsis sp. IMI 355080]|nr:hypothetical protein N0V82_000849 [Gnomoniopsis sp. IMI 355080]
MAGQDHLRNIQTLMGMDEYSADADKRLLDDYLIDLKADQSLSGPYIEHMDDETIELFQRSEDYRTWSHSGESSMLTLTGYNHFSIEASALHCWVSPMAVSVFNKLHMDSTPDDVFSLHIVGLRGKEDLPKIVFSLLFQLLKLRPAYLLNEEQHMELLAELQAHKRSATVDNMTSLKKIAIRVLNLFVAPKTVWLLVDRVHLCQRGTESGPSRLMELFVYLVQSSKTRVRVLVVADGNDAYWQLDRSLGEIKDGKSPRVISHVANQRSIGEKQ